MATVVRLATVTDCPANGIVTITEELIGCSAEREMSAEVPSLPVLVVTSPVIDAWAVLAPVCRATGTRPSALPGCTPVMTVAA
jgi:hypothetical protein